MIKKEEIVEKCWRYINKCSIGTIDYILSIVPKIAGKKRKIMR